jgi:hypothetical protein
MDLRVYFDFSPNAPDWTPETQRKPPYEFQEFAARSNFIQANPPKTLLTTLKQLGWPPSPTYYPSLIQTMAQPGGDAPAMIASTIIAIHGAQYWARRITLWSELKIFSNGCGLECAAPGSREGISAGGHSISIALLFSRSALEARA